MFTRSRIRHFRCALQERDVEVTFEERGIPGLRWSAAVTSCSAFDPPTAIDCRRQCLDSTFRRQWEPALPVMTDRSGLAA
jgi:hypothetical protein